MQVIGLTEKACNDAVNALIEEPGEGTLSRTDVRPMRFSELILTAEQYKALKTAGALIPRTARRALNSQR